MQIILAKTAGFCFGVDRAVEMVNESVRRGNKTATLGPIIHNRHVVERFLKQGVREIAVPAQAEPGETVIIRAHGVPKQVQQALCARGVRQDEFRLGRNGSGEREPVLPHTGRGRSAARLL